jgi:hypothetical protein
MDAPGQSTTAETETPPLSLFSTANGANKANKANEAGSANLE